MKADPLDPNALDMITTGNISAAVAAIQASADTEAALESFSQLCTRAYRELKSVPAMTAIAWEAVGFGLSRSAVSSDPQAARNYKSRIRAIAYNAAANCWPGWGDGVEINAADIAEGLKLAERSYELVEELGLGDKAIGAGRWLVGALQLAAGRSSMAIGQFSRAEEAFQAARLPEQTAMARGYSALARKMLPESHLTGAESLAAIVLSLRAMESREAQFFADQLITADRILCANAS
jgi:hypothetical protein